MKMGSLDREWPQSRQGLTAANECQTREGGSGDGETRSSGNLQVIPPIAGANAIVIGSVRGVEGQAQVRWN